jgi:hypothetical protein
MKTILILLLLGAAAVVACVLYSRPVLHVQPVYERGVVVACQHYYSVPLKNGGEFRYQWRPELEAFCATNAAALR